MAESSSIGVMNQREKAVPYRPDDSTVGLTKGVRKMPHSGVYAITNTVTGDVYVGSSNHIERRWKKHLNDLRKGTHHSIYLQRAFAKYGESAFVFSILEDVLPERLLLIEREQRWIETTRPVYNMNPLATNNLGMPASEALRQHLLRYSLMRTAEERRVEQLGKKRSEETRRKQSEKATGRTHTEASKQKMREKKLGKRHTEEEKHKVSETLKGRPRNLTEEQVQKIAQSNRETWAKKTAEEKHSYTQKRPPVSDEARKRMSEAAKRRKRKISNNNL